MSDVVELYRDASKGWRWRLVSANGKILSSGESHRRKWNAKRAAKRANPGVSIIVAEPWPKP